MLVNCSTKPINGVLLFQQISFAIGVWYYPAPSTQHYSDLHLDTFSWLYRLRDSVVPA
jgi:hypothetical protein